MYAWDSVPKANRNLTNLQNRLLKKETNDLECFAPKSEMDKVFFANACYKGQQFGQHSGQSSNPRQSKPVKKEYSHEERKAFNK
jgi:hypothetical protein